MQKKGLFALALVLALFSFNACSDDDDGSSSNGNGNGSSEQDFSGPQGGFAFEANGESYDGSIAIVNFDDYAAQGYDAENDAAAVIALSSGSMQDGDNFNIGITITHEGETEIQEAAYEIYTNEEQASTSELLTGATVNFTDTEGQTFFTISGGNVVVTSVSEDEIELEINDVELEEVTSGEPVITINGSLRAVTME